MHRTERPARSAPAHSAPARRERVVRTSVQHESQGNEGEALGGIRQDNELVPGFEAEMLAGLGRYGDLPALSDGDRPEEAPAVGPDVGRVSW